MSSSDEGRASAFASRKEREDWWEAGRARERCRPTASMAGLMSEMVTWTFGLPLLTWACCSMRKAMSPVPPATSRMRWGMPGGFVAPGLSEETK
ncbi:hypothetical protein TgHK011_002914 [Trichoderma gracile]|nr:hypothetical protein TgHK011_002914 [Trichoderma gracile]